MTHFENSKKIVFGLAVVSLVLAIVSTQFESPSVRLIWIVLALLVPFGWMGFAFRRDRLEIRKVHNQLDGLKKKLSQIHEEFDKSKKTNETDAIKQRFDHQSQLIHGILEQFKVQVEALSTTSDSCGKATEGALKSKTSVHQLIELIDSIKTSVSSVQTQVTQSNLQFSEMVRMIQEIGSKTKVIDDIVFQTRLLSFNASVEAARAGEHGKGFAVVAEEVGNLAKMSGGASQEIAQLLVKSTKRVEEIVQATQSQVGSLVTTAQRASEAAGEKVQDAESQISTLIGFVEAAQQKIVLNLEEFKKLEGELSSSQVDSVPEVKPEIKPEIRGEIKPEKITEIPPIAKTSVPQAEKVLAPVIPIRKATEVPKETKPALGVPQENDPRFVDL